MYKPTENTLGEFTEKDYGNVFTFSETGDKWALEYGFKHQIDVGESTRFCNVGVTVAYVCIDESADCRPIVERWQVRTKFYQR